MRNESQVSIKKSKQLSGETVVLKNIHFYTEKTFHSFMFFVKK